MIWEVLVFTAIILLGIWLFVHRDPMRYITPTAAYLSPADGVVVSVRQVTSSHEHVKKKKGGVDVFLDDFPDAAYIITIMLQLHHVHTQRAPIPGIIKEVVYRRGEHLSAVGKDYEQATHRNEHVGITLEDNKRKVKVYLVAGLVARRVVSIVERDDRVQQGQRIGRIKLGSQVILVLPPCDILVGAGDRVFAGLTEVAR